MQGGQESHLEANLTEVTGECGRVCGCTKVQRIELDARRLSIYSSQEIAERKKFGDGERAQKKTRCGGAKIYKLAQCLDRGPWILTRH